MSVFDVLVATSLVLLALAAACCLVRVARGPSALDRVIALDVFLVVVAASVAVRGSREGVALDATVLLVVALLGFTGSVTAARLVERRPR